MLLLILGLILFTGIHSLRLGGDASRTRLLNQLGAVKFKGLYSLISIVGFILMVYGFGLASDTPIPIWSPPSFTKWIAYFLTLLAMVLMVATYVPNNRIRAKLHHPMVLSVKTWALAHLIANGTLAHILLFGTLLVWSVLLFRASRVRDKQMQVVYVSGNGASTWLTLEIGLALWLIFVGWLHGWIVGVQVLMG
jgi:uncharacterized membrane protein